jgi:hypothetical protein
VDESCDEDEGEKDALESTEEINTKEKTSWKAQREREVRCSGQGC